MTRMNGNKTISGWGICYDMIVSLPHFGDIEMKKCLHLMSFIIFFLLCGCGGHPSDRVVRPSAVPQKWVTKTAIPPLMKTTEPLAVLSDDPWEQCEALGITESTAENVAEIRDPEFRRRVQITLMIQEPDTGKSFIGKRCMNGKVYVCLIGPQTNCAERLDISVTPNEQMKAFCADPDREGSIVSPVVSGINSAYEWRCHEGTAQITAVLAEGDEAGYDRSIWFEIPKPEENEIIIIRDER